MDFNIIEENGGYRGVLKGRLDTAAAVEFNEKIQPLIQNADRPIELDCKDLEYISSSGLRAFLTIRKAAGAKGGKVAISHINSEIEKVFKMTGFYNLFEVR